MQQSFPEIIGCEIPRIRIVDVGAMLQFRCLNIMETIDTM